MAKYKDFSYFPHCRKVNEEKQIIKFRKGEPTNSHV